MTPTEQDKMSDEELYQSITDICFENGGVTKPMADKLMQLITADRKRVELEARIDENNMYIRELTRHYFPSSPSEPHIPLVQFYERIAELKAQQEEV